MDEVECGLQVCVYHGIPLSLVHSHHQAVLCDAGIVDQNIYMSEGRLYVLHYFMGIFEGSCIRCIGLRANAHSFKLRNERLRRLVLRPVGESDVCSFSCELQGNRSSYTSCRSCYERCLSCEKSHFPFVFKCKIIHWPEIAKKIRPEIG